MRRILLAALAIVWTVLMACTPPQQSSTSKSRTQASDQDLFVQLSRVFCDESSDKGTPYVANTLEPCVLPADPVNGVEDMVINLDSVDCTTFVEYMAAAMLAGVKAPDRNDSLLRQKVQALRYRNGQRGNYASRKHYFSEWISDNVAQGLMTDVTESCAGAVHVTKKINFMSTHPQSYTQLSASSELVEQIRKVEERLSASDMCYVPCDRIADNFQNLKAGDIIAFVTSIHGLDIQHVGMVWWPDTKTGSPRLLHASSAKGRVMISPNSIADYASKAKNCVGIKVVRL